MYNCREAIGATTNGLYSIDTQESHFPAATADASLLNLQIRPSRKNADGEAALRAPPARFTKRPYGRYAEIA